MAMLDQSLKRDDIICFFLSEHEDYAMERLGFQTQAECFGFLADIFPSRPASSFRRLRDEYDALTSNRRLGQRLRKPASRVQSTFDTLKFVPREDILEYVLEQIESNLRNTASLGIPVVSAEIDKSINELEKEIEELVNAKDATAGFYIRNTERKIRKYSVGITRKLKKIYRGRCQLCGSRPFPQLANNTDITECHHIDYFAKSQNNDASNIVVLCPNHHALLHREDATFEKETACFVLANGEKLPIMLDEHLFI